METRRSYDHLISTMGFPVLVRQHLYIESGPRSFKGSHCHVITTTLCQCIQWPPHRAHKAYLPLWLLSLNITSMRYHLSILWFKYPISVLNGCKIPAEQEEHTMMLSYHYKKSHVGDLGPDSILRSSFPCITMLRIRQLQDHLIFNMGIPILVRWHL